MEDRLFDPTPTLSVSEVLSRARVVVERAFGDEVWIEGEIQNLPENRARTRHLYFDLVDRGTTVGSPAPAGRPLRPEPTRGVNVLLKRSGGKLRMADGLNVRLRGQVTVYERTGQVQLRMTAIDPNHTIGLLAAERDRVLEALSAEGLLAANGRRPLVGPPLRVALLTSQGSAAAEDFLHELTASGLGFASRLHDVRVQGREAEPTIVAALAAVDPATTDVVALVRGGGARTDLAAFDAEGIARAIAGLQVPLITGLGHEIDRAVADEVAHTSLKTPTACAAWLVDRVRAWLVDLDDAWAAVADRALVHLDRADQRVHRAARRAVVVQPPGPRPGRPAPPGPRRRDPPPWPPHPRPGRPAPDPVGRPGQRLRPRPHPGPGLVDHPDRRRRASSAPPPTPPPAPRWSPPSPTASWPAGPSPGGHPHDRPAEPGYAEALAELESILAELDDDRLDVDALAERVQRAAHLVPSAASAWPAPASPSRRSSPTWTGTIPTDRLLPLGAVV